MKKRKLFKTLLACGALGFAVSGVATLSSATAHAATPSLGDKIAAIKGIDATYDSALAEASSGINTAKAMPTIRSGNGNTFVIVQYDLAKVAQSSTAANYGMNFGTTLQNGGLLYGNGWSTVEGAEGDFGNGLVYGNTAGGSPFMATENVNKTITFVYNRETTACALYTSEIGAKLTYDNTSGFSVTGATAQAISLPNYWGYWGANDNVTAAAPTVVTLSKWSTMNGLLIGDGTASLENIKIFDENGNDLGVLLGNDFVATLEEAEGDYLMTGKTTDTAIRAPINTYYKASVAGVEETSADPLNDNLNNVMWTSRYSEDDSIFSHNMPTAYGANLTTDGVAIGLYFARGNYKTQLDFGTKAKLEQLESITVRIWSDVMAYTEGASGAGTIQLFNSKNETVAAGSNSVNLWNYLPETVTASNPLKDYAELTIPVEDLAVLADEDGYLSGVQLVRVNANNAGWLFIDSIRANYDYPVKYDELSYGSVTADNRLAEVGETVTLTVTNTVKENYAFDPKVLKEDGTEVALTKTGDHTYTFTMVEGEVKVSLFQIPVYAINYVLDGGVNGENPTTWSRESDVTALADANKEYYVFKGWYLDSSFKTAFTGFAENIFVGKETLDVYAKFEKQTFTVTFDSKGGTKINSQTVAWGEMIEEPTAPVKEYCEFVGWTLDGEEYTFGEMPKSDIKLVAVYAANEYEVTATGSEHIQITVAEKAAYESTVNVTLAVTAGYELANLSITANGASVEYFELNGTYAFVMPHDNVTITVTEQVEKYRISYANADGLINMNAIEYTVLSPVTFAEIEKDGYTFDGWYKDETLTQKIESTTGITGNLTVYAKFTEIKKEASEGCGGVITGAMSAITLLGAAVLVFKRKK